MGVSGLSGCASSDGADPAELSSKTKMPLMLSVSANSACVLKSNLKPVCQGAVGTGSTLLKTYTQIAVSDDTFCGLREGGALTTKGTITCNGARAVVEGKPQGGGYGTLIAGRRHFCVVHDGNKFTCWGPDCKDQSQCWHPKNTSGKSFSLKDGWVRYHSEQPIQNISAGDDITCYQPTADKIQCFGNVSHNYTVLFTKENDKDALGVAGFSVGSKGFCAVLNSFKSDSGTSRKIECYSGKKEKILLKDSPVSNSHEIKYGGDSDSGVTCAKVFVSEEKEWLCTGKSAAYLRSFTGTFETSYDATLQCKIETTNSKQVECNGYPTAQNTKLANWKL